MAAVWNCAILKAGFQIPTLLDTNVFSVELIQRGYLMRQHQSF